MGSRSSTGHVPERSRPGPPWGPLGVKGHGELGGGRVSDRRPRPGGRRGRISGTFPESSERLRQAADAGSGSLDAWGGRWPSSSLCPSPGAVAAAPGRGQRALSLETPFLRVSLRRRELSPPRQRRRARSQSRRFGFVSSLYFNEKEKKRLRSPSTTCLGLGGAGDAVPLGVPLSFGRRATRVSGVCGPHGGPPPGRHLHVVASWPPPLGRGAGGGRTGLREPGARAPGAGARAEGIREGGEGSVCPRGGRWPRTTDKCGDIGHEDLTPGSRGTSRLQRGRLQAPGGDGATRVLG